MQQNKTVSIVEGSLCIALSFILSQFFLFRFSQDGAISFELTPLIILTYRRGFKIGVISGAVFGLIRCILGGYFMNIIQVLLDYPLAFACVGFAAIRPKILGLIIAALGTISCSVISGVIFFSQFAPEGQNPFIYSLAVNVPILGGLYILSGAAALILWKYLEKVLI
ncbi:MAG: energy-coupled thiamine transporter ThiT [Synergistaceae bacterium]|nr:energy-coupled thiamine transporter ThiT [Synergistaceae bacterium]